MTSLAEVPQILARPMGPRGSRDLVGSADPTAELSDATVDVLSAIPAWWSERAAQAGLSGEWLDVTRAVDALPPGFLNLETSSGQHLKLSTAEEVGSAYSESLSAPTRVRHGRHYTPSELSKHLWSMTRSGLGMSESNTRLPGLIRDPACGAGALLLLPLREHLAASSQDDPLRILGELPSLIEGVDSDPLAVWIANVVLAAEMLPMLAEIPSTERQPLPSLARVGDGLVSRMRAARAILMNPPYGRVRLSQEDRARFSKTLFGHANLYGMFMAAGAESLDSHGVLTALVPTSFTSGRYFEPLRSLLSTQFHLNGITFIAKRSGVFSSVLQETCIATFTTQPATKTAVSAIGKYFDEVADVPVPRGGKPWVLPRAREFTSVAEHASTLPNTLASTGWKVTTGPLVWNRRKADLAPRASANSVHIVWAADIDNGTLIRHASRDVTRYLAVQSDRDMTVMVLTEPAILVQRTSAPEQNRRLALAELDHRFLMRVGGGVVVENHVNVIQPCGNQAMLSRELLFRILSSDVFDILMRCISGSVAISAYELESLPLPDAQTLASWEGLSDSELDVALSQTYGFAERSAL